MTFARKKDRQAQMMVAGISAPMSVDNIQLTLKQKIKIRGTISEDALYFQKVKWYSKLLNAGVNSPQSCVYLA
jgi:hypothetical protein